MDILLISTYDLGHQPQDAVELGGQLASMGARVHLLDLAISLDLAEQLPDLATRGPLEGLGDAIAHVDAVVMFFSMLTSSSIAITALEGIGADQVPLRPALFFTGLYAPLLADELNLAERFHATILAPSDPRLVARVVLGLPEGSPKKSTYIPLRSIAAPLDAYRTVTTNRRTKLVGTVATTTGCRHRCRHCPVPILANGRIGIWQVDEVIADIEQLLSSGAEHISFTDPDFFNAPIHAMKVLRALHDRAPEVTFDATIKVEHLIREHDRLEELVSLGASYIVSAFESLSDEVLTHLDKGHTSEDIYEVLAATDHVGLDIHPSFVPFTPWSTIDDIVAICSLIYREGLSEVVEPVQLGIRLLVPPKSLLLADPTVANIVEDFDEQTLSYRWHHLDRRVDALQQEIAAIAEEGAEEGESFLVTHRRIAECVESSSGREILIGEPRQRRASAVVSSESWFCCAEPMPSHLDRTRALVGGTPHSDSTRITLPHHP